MKGSTANGLIIYENGDFAYSHHGTDPVSGRLCNAFDLVRLHKFGHLDEIKASKAHTSKLPSYEVMMEFCMKDEAVKVTLGKEKLESVKKDIGDNKSCAEGDSEWLKKLELNKEGKYRATAENIVLILQNDPYLKGKIALNEFSHRTTIRGDLPWHNVENI